MQLKYKDKITLFNSHNFPISNYVRSKSRFDLHKVCLHCSNNHKLYILIYLSVTIWLPGDELINNIIMYIFSSFKYFKIIAGKETEDKF